MKLLNQQRSIYFLLFFLSFFVILKTAWSPTSYFSKIKYFKFIFIFINQLVINNFKRKKISIVLRGKKRSEETKRKVSEAKKGIIVNEETKAK